MALFKWTACALAPKSWCEPVAMTSHCPSPVFSPTQTITPKHIQQHPSCSQLKLFSEIFCDCPLAKVEPICFAPVSSFTPEWTMKCGVERAWIASTNHGGEKNRVQISPHLLPPTFLLHLEHLENFPANKITTSRLRIAHKTISDVIPSRGLS